jgi:hypothetical protein
VIDNIVWTDSWLGIAGAGCGLTRVGADEEQLQKVVAGEASRCGEDKLASFEGPGGQWGQVRAAWWHEQQDVVVDGFLVEPQNQGRAGTTWESSHEWRLAEATLSLWGLQWFTRKPLGYSVEPQNRGRRLDEGVRPPRPVQLPRRGGQTAWGRSDLPGRSNRPGGAV